MAVKLFALYAKPDDEEAFLRHYHDIHLPLVRKVPGLRSATISRVDTDLMGGEPAYFLIAEMTFADQAAFEVAMASPENRSAGKDLMNFAKGKVTLLSATE